MKFTSQLGMAGTLALVWFACFVVALALPFLLLVTASIDSSTLLPALDQISTVYAPHIGVVLAFYFAASPKGARRSRFKSGSFIAALLATGVWNALVVGSLLLVPLGVFRIEVALSFVGGSAPKLSWMVAPTLGFFFAKPGEATQKD